MNPPEFHIMPSVLSTFISFGPSHDPIAKIFSDGKVEVYRPKDLPEAYKQFWEGMGEPLQKLTKEKEALYDLLTEASLLLVEEREKNREKDEEINFKEKTIEHLYSRLTCMCGDSVESHGPVSDHPPVPIYDYDLDNALKRISELEGKAERIWKRIIPSP